MFTYGKTKAAIRLEEILGEITDEELFRKAKRTVGKIYHKFTRGLTEIEEMQFHREHMTFLWRNDFIKNIEEKIKLPEVIKTHLANIIHAETRNSLRGKWLDDPQFSKALKKDILVAEQWREKEHKEYVTSKINIS